MRPPEGRKKLHPLFPKFESSLAAYRLLEGDEIKRGPGSAVMCRVEAVF